MSLMSEPSGPAGRSAPSRPHLPRWPSVFPAVDLRGGRCVRLVRGARGAEIDYGGDPAQAARRWADQGAEWIHAIDLGGALGEPDSLDVILAIAREVPVPVQAGGGLRDLEQINRLLEGRVARVILGTRALREPEFLQTVISRHGPERVVLAMDMAAGRVRVKGWEEESSFDLPGGLVYAKEAGVEHVLITAIDRDGTLTGPGIPLIRQAIDEGFLAVVAAGGIGKLEDLRSLLELRRERLEGVVVGRALYEGTVSLPDAVRLSREYKK